MSRISNLRVPAYVFGALAIAAVGAREARACGGFFCNAPPPDGSLPIAQAAENVLFVLDTDPATGAHRVEAHIQIAYTGPATSFSWIVPVTAVPTVDVGWDILFDRIEPPTRPSFVLTRVDGREVPGWGKRHRLRRRRRGQAPAAAAPGQPMPTVDVLSRGSVGPFDYVVVRSEDGATLRTWLTDNGYFVSADSAKIVDDYVATGHSFVAVRLKVGQDTSAIRPIILRMESPEACLPLKLTAIASTPNLRINVWVLAAARAIPINYAEIGINLAKIDWFNFGRNYDQLLQEAANEAQGNAFAVEYAQRSAAAVGLDDAWSSGARSTLASQADPASYMARAREHRRHADERGRAGAAQVHPDAGDAAGPRRHRSAVLREHPVLLEQQPRELRAVRSGGAHRRAGDRGAAADGHAPAAVRAQRLPDPPRDVHLARGDDEGSGVRDQRPPARRVAPAQRDRAPPVRRRGVRLLRRAGQHRARGRPQRPLRGRRMRRLAVARGHRQDAVGGGRLEPRSGHGRAGRPR